MDGHGMPRWRQIYGTLAEEMQQGILRPGHRLPTEPELAERFGVNRHTLRRAMAELRDDGLVRIERGRGTFVQEEVIDYPVTRRTRFSDIMIMSDHEPGQRALRALEMPADAEVARELGMVRGDPLLLVETIHEADARPLSVTAHYFPKARCEGLLEAYRESGSITQALYNVGIRDYFRQTTRVTTRLPTETEARHLRQSSTLPVLLTQSVNVDADGYPVEYSIARYAGQRVALVFKPK
jgi:GntR family phosphonate transport system transcriptional regulator